MVYLKDLHIVSPLSNLSQEIFPSCPGPSLNAPALAWRPSYNKIHLIGHMEKNHFSFSVSCYIELFSKMPRLGNSLVVQWLGLGTFTAKGPGSVPGRGTKIPQAMQLCHRQQ